MKIGIVGAGQVGGTLGVGFAKAGHHVFFGSRDPQTAEMQALLARAGSTAKAESVANAVQFADVVVVALPWPATQSVVQSLDLHGKVVLDCTNPLLPDFSGLEPGTSGGERVADWAAGATVVKVFNTTGFNNMADPAYGGKPAFMPYCGDDAAAKQTAAQLATDLGFEAVDLGSLSHAHLLEAWAMTWIWLAIQGGLGRDFAFQLVRR